MGVMKRDVNFVFFILIIAVVVSFAGFTAYYQVSFRNINEEYNTKLAELNKVTKELLEKKSSLLQTTTELNTTKQGREELGEKYGDLKTERDALEEDRNTYRDNYCKTKSELEQKTSQVNTLTTELDATKSDRDRWKNKYDECDADLEECEDNCP